MPFTGPPPPLTLPVTVTVTVTMASWACSHCTFLNPPSQKSLCSVCLSPAAAAVASPSPAACSFRTWSCRACTFANPFGTRSCEVCGTRAAAAPYAAFDDFALDEDDLSDPSIGSVFRPLQRCSSVSVADDDDVEVVEPPAEKMSGKEAAASSVAGLALPPMQRCSKKRWLTDAVANSHGEKMPRKEDVPSTAAGVVNTTSKTGVLKVLTYNVWFREDLELNKRMKAIGDLIHQHTPDVICFQEVTPNIYEIFQRSNWWKGYKCSLSYDMVADKAYFCIQMSKLPVKKFSCRPFGYSAMGRELSVADVDAGMGKSLVVATSHLESPCPGPPKWDQMYSKERVAQARESINILDASPNVIFCGDMNWDDKLDGPFPVSEGWIDAWTVLRPGEEGWTYDTKANLMLSGNRKLQKRLDRFMCSLRDFEVSGIEMIGMEAIPGLCYGKEKKVKSEYQMVMLPVLPSDHFGLLLTISRK